MTKAFDAHALETTPTGTSPVAEPAAATMQNQVPSSAGSDWADQVAPELERPFLYPPFPGPVRAVLHHLQKTFGAVYARPLEDWETGLRRTVHPDWELDDWLFTAERYAKLTRNRTWSPAHRLELFQVVRAYGTAGFEGALAVPVQVLSEVEVQTLLAELDALAERRPSAARRAMLKKVEAFVKPLKPQVLAGLRQKISSERGSDGLE